MVILWTEQEIRKGKEGTWRTRYRCDWCRNEWEATVHASGTGKQRQSDQVTCPNCHNYIATWT